MSSILPSLSSVGAFACLVLGFAFIIFVHELGHFLVAKAVGIKCLQFAIGMGPAIFCYRKGMGISTGSSETEYQKRLDDGAAPQSLGETEYRICWLPLGGYVKMLGQEDMDPGARSSDPRSFTSKPAWARACVLSAGVVMNILFGSVFFIIAFMAGVAFPPAVAGHIVPDMPAAEVYAEGHDHDEAYKGLRTEDRILEVDGRPVGDFMELALETALARPNHELRLVVQRPQDDGSSERLVFVVKPRKSNVTHLLSLGIGRPKTLSINMEPPVLASLRDAGVQSDMVLTAVDGKPVTSYGAFTRLITSARGRPLPLTFVDPQTSESVTVPVGALAGLMRHDAAGPKKVDMHLIGLVPAAIVGEVVDGEPAQKAGVQPGDVIQSIDSVDWPSERQVRVAIKDAGPEAMSLTLRRGEELIRVEDIRPRNGLLGIGFGREPLIARVLPNTPAAALELSSGSRITDIAGTGVESFADMQRLLQDIAVAHPEGTSFAIGARVNVKGQPAEQRTITIDAATADRIRATRWHQPIGAFKLHLIETKADNPLAAAALGIDKTHQSMLHVYVTLARLFQGTIQPSHLRGPVGIAHEGTKVAKQGWTYLMFFLGLISVNLAVINFLPIPIVDGGHIVFLIIEKLKGSPVSARVQVAATVVGMALIASILLMTLFYDSHRLITGG